MTYSQWSGAFAELKKAKKKHDPYEKFLVDSYFPRRQELHAKRKQPKAKVILARSSDSPLMQLNRILNIRFEVFVSRYIVSISFRIF